MEGQVRKAGSSEIKEVRKRLLGLMVRERVRPREMRAAPRGK
jgi:hypothetical protein